MPADLLQLLSDLIHEITWVDVVLFALIVGGHAIWWAKRGRG